MHCPHPQFFRVPVDQLLRLLRVLNINVISLSLLMLLLLLFSLDCSLDVIIGLKIKLICSSFIAKRMTFIFKKKVELPRTSM